MSKPKPKKKQPSYDNSAQIQANNLLGQITKEAAAARQGLHDYRVRQEQIDRENAARQAEQWRIEQQRIAEQKRIEQQRIAEQKRIEQQRIAEQKRIEQQRLAEQKLRDEQWRVEQQRIAEQKRIEQQKLAEQKLRDEQWRVEQQRIAEQKKQQEANKTGSNDYITISQTINQECNQRIQIELNKLKVQLIGKSCNATQSPYRSEDGN